MATIYFKEDIKQFLLTCKRFEDFLAKLNDANELTEKCGFCHGEKCPECDQTGYKYNDLWTFQALTHLKTFFTQLHNTNPQAEIIIRNKQEPIPEGYTRYTIETTENEITNYQHEFIAPQNLSPQEVEELFLIQLRSGKCHYLDSKPVSTEHILCTITPHSP